MEDKEKIPQEVEKAENQAETAQEKVHVKREQEPLDMETTVADMNVEGFGWYAPNRKKKKADRVSVSKKEYRAMVRGAFSAMIPMFLCMLAAFAIVFVLAYLWLKP